MKSTKKRAVKKDDKILAQGRIWNEEAYMRYRQYQTEFNKKRYRMFGIRMLNETEKDLIKWLESKDNLDDYMKALIRKDMEKAKKAKK